MGKYTLDFTASEINNRLSKLDNTPISMELVWQNASPSSEFAAQTIELDLSKYTKYEIEFLFHTAETHINIQKSVVGNKMLLCLNDAGSIYRRNVASTASSLYFSDMVGSHNTGSSINDNNYLIPCRVYGIKGV